MSDLKITTTNNNLDSKLIDARGPRFGALLTTLVLAITLITKNPAFLIWQGLVFAIGAFITPTKTPYAFIYRKLIKPLLKGDVPVEDIRPPKFAQAVGFLFAIVGTLGAFLGSSAVFLIATAFALAAAFLNAAFNFCLGCEIYLLLTRLTSRFKS